MGTGLTRRRFLGASSIACWSGGRLAGAPAGGGAKPVEFRRGGMVYRRLGQTDLMVSLLSFGSHTDPAFKRPGPLTTVLTEEGQKRRDRQIAKAFDRGVNTLDIYESEGQWEPAAGLARGRRDKLVLSLCHNNPEPIGINIGRAAKLFGHCDLYRFHTAAIDGQALEHWDVLRKAKEAGQVRAIGIATHVEQTMIEALKELEGIDFLFFPYNFIHARADYSRFLPEALKRNVGLVAMKPLATGSLVHLDPRANAGARPEADQVVLWQSGTRTVHPQAVAELTKALNRLPDETLCMAALRFVFARPFIHCAMTGMFDERWVDDNCAALQRYQEGAPGPQAALEAVREATRRYGASWLPPDYRWLEQQWR